MQVTCCDRARQGKEGFRLLQQATTRLEEILGKSAARVTAAWDRTDDEKGGVHYAIWISDRADEASARFALDELQSASRMEFPLVSLWGDVLQKRNPRQLEALLRSDGSET